MELAMTLGSMMTEWFALPCDHRRQAMDRVPSLEPAVLYGKRRGTGKPGLLARVLRPGRAANPAGKAAGATSQPEGTAAVALNLQEGGAAPSGESGGSPAVEESGGDDADPEIRRRPWRRLAVGVFRPLPFRSGIAGAGALVPGAGCAVPWPLCFSHLIVLHPEFCFGNH